MIAIMIPIKPYWFAKILNGEKGIEIRKNKALAKAIQKLIDTQGYAPILGYCSKGEEVLLHCFLDNKDIGHKAFQYNTKNQHWLDNACYDDTNKLNGKVPALLICRKVEEITPNISLCDNEINTFLIDSKIDVLKASCLTEYEMEKYLCPNYDGDKPLEYLDKVVGYAIHISQLEIFDKPKELSEFRVFPKLKSIETDEDFYLFTYGKPLTKAPQNYCYVEVE